MNWYHKGDLHSSMSTGISCNIYFQNNISKDINSLKLLAIVQQYKLLLAIHIEK